MTDITPATNLFDRVSLTSLHKTLDPALNFDWKLVVLYSETFGLIWLKFSQFVVVSMAGDDLVETKKGSSKNSKDSNESKLKQSNALCIICCTIDFNWD